MRSLASHRVVNCFNSDVSGVTCRPVCLARASSTKRVLRLCKSDIGPKQGAGVILYLLINNRKRCP